MTSIHEFPAAVDLLPVPIGELGCLMLDVVPFDPTVFVPGGEADLHTSDNPDRWWVKGAVVADSAHLTLHYGFLQKAYEIADVIGEVLEGTEIPEFIWLDGYGIFPSPYEDEPYDCVVAHVKLTDEILAIRERLLFLPHVHTFDGYRAHVTIAYVAHGAGERWVERLNKRGPVALPSATLNYGSR